MGNLLLSGFSQEWIKSVEFDSSNYPPWVMLWIPCVVDLFCSPLGCRYTWRQYLPSFLTGDAENGWFAEKYQVSGIGGEMYRAGIVTFEDFQRKQGLEVTPGSGDWFKALYTYFIKTDNTSLSNLLSPPGLCAVFCLALLIRIFKSFAIPTFQSMGRELARNAHGEAWVNDDNNQVRLVKFGEQIWRLLYHSAISLVGVYFFMTAPWWNKEKGFTNNLWVDFPGDPVPPALTWYYLLQASYNVDAMMHLLEISFEFKYPNRNSFLPTSIGWAKTVRSDFPEMMVHHIATNALVFLSSFVRQTKVGSMVFWMHDISDVTVDMAKMANFLKWHYTTASCFFLLCATWIATRLYVLPFVIWKSIYTESLALIADKEKDSHDYIYFYAYVPLFMILLAILILLHLLWFGMFIKMAQVLLTKGECKDLSESNGLKAKKTKAS